MKYWFKRNRLIIFFIVIGSIAMYSLIRLIHNQVVEDSKTKYLISWPGHAPVTVVRDELGGTNCGEYFTDTDGHHYQCIHDLQIDEIK